MRRSGTVLGVALFALAAAPLLAIAQPPPLPPPPPVPTAAQEPQKAPDEFQARVERAAQLVDADLQAAIELLDHLAVESLELRKTRPLSADERPAHRQAFILRARVHLQALNNDKVDESLRELLRVDPFFSAPLAPKEQELVDGLRRAETGLLEVTSSVRDCRVLLDNIEIGVTGDAPVRASIINGLYELRLEKPGYESAVSRITIVAGQPLVIGDLAPQPKIPPIVFLVDRAGIEVVVNNVPSGKTIPVAAIREQMSAEETAALARLVTESRFDAGTSAAFLLREPPVDKMLIVRFRGDCLIEESRTVSVTAESLAVLDATAALLWYGETTAVRMQPDVGMLRVASVPTDADVYVDGALAGRTPFERNVCTGEHRVRVRHRIGSYQTAATVARGRTAVIDVTLKPGMAFLGAVEGAPGTPRLSGSLTTTIDRALATTVKSFRLATMIDLPPEIERWTDTATLELVSAAGRGDTEALKRLLKVASENYDAPLLAAAVSRGAGGSDSPLDFLLFWHDHAAIDQVSLAGASSESFAEFAQRLDRPADPSGLVYHQDLGIRLVDTAVPGASLMVVSVASGSPAAVAGVRPGDTIAAADGSALTSSGVAEEIDRKKPGDVIVLSYSRPGLPPQQAALPVQRQPRRAPVFDPAAFGNVTLAKLQAGLAVATAAPERDLLSFNLALIQMRFRQWRPALDALGKLDRVPAGLGVGPGAVLYFRARCHEELGEMDRAVALLQEAARVEAEVLASDGATTAAVAKLRLAALAETGRLPAK